LSRNDGFWLADGTDCFPPDLCKFKIFPGLKKESSRDPHILAGFAGLQKLALGNEIVVDAAWTFMDGVDLIIRSVLVDPDMAEEIAFTVATAEPFDRWLPRENDFMHLQGNEINALQPFTTCEQNNYELDLDDPYAASSALDRPRPVDTVIKAFGLTQGDQFGRLWIDQSGSTIFYAEAWGGGEGDGRRKSEKTGIRLRCRADALLSLLSVWNKKMVLLIKTPKYIEHKGGQTSKSKKNYGLGTFQINTLVMTLCPTQGVKCIRRIPRKIRLAIESIPLCERPDFSSRLRAIRLSKYRGC
jgi:hypothetical protein